MSTAKQPTRMQIERAADWLRYNEGEEDGEREDCRAVADFLEALLLDSEIKAEARRAGIPVALARRRVAEVVARRQEPR